MPPALELSQQFLRTQYIRDAEINIRKPDGKRFLGKEEKEPKICKNEECKKSFVPNHASRLYCSSSCRIRDKKRDRNNYRRRSAAVYNYMKRNCPKMLKKIEADIGNIEEVPDGRLKEEEW